MSNWKEKIADEIAAEVIEQLSENEDQGTEQGTITIQGDSYGYSYQVQLRPTEHDE